MYTKPNISIITVNFHSAEPLRRCWETLYAAADVSFETIVYDNGSTPDELNFLTSYGTRVLGGKHNVGFGAACNIASWAASGTYLLFLNPDTAYRSGSFADCIGVLETSPEVGIIGPRLFLSNGEQERWSYGDEVTLWNTLRNNLPPYSKKRRRVSTTEETHWVSGAALCVRREDFLSLGGFDERYFMYFEDVDLCRRLRTQGKKVLTSSILEFTHVGGASFQKSPSTLQKQYYYTSQDLYFRRHFGPFHERCVRALRGVANFFSV